MKTAKFQSPFGDLLIGNQGKEQLDLQIRERFQSPFGDLLIGNRRHLKVRGDKDLRSHFREPQKRCSEGTQKTLNSWQRPLEESSESV